MKFKYCLLALCSSMVIGCGGGGSGGDTDTIAAGCPGIENPNPTNTDGDLLFDVCDPDDDGDGFNDVDDPAPLDPNVPGNFSTPEAILSNDAIQTALQEADTRGFPLETEVGLNPPDLTGYYLRGDGVGSFPVTSSGTEQGRGLVGGETRVEQSQNNFLQSASVSFTEGMPVSFGTSEGTIIRGEGNRYTTYSRSKSTCTEQGSSYDIFGVSVASGEINQTTGDIENFRSISTTVDVAGQLTTVCANRQVATTELAGSWIVTDIPVTRKVIPAELTFMCVSGDAAYAPTETWTNTDGLSCSCTTNYEEVCQ